MKSGSGAFDIDDFISKLVIFMGGRKTMNLDDDDDSNWKWEQLIDQPRDLTDKSEFHHSKPISMFA